VKRARILIVEDELIVAADLQNNLQDLGYAVPDFVSTGVEAISVAGRTDPDLVIMDIRLSGDMDGINAAEHLRKRYGYPIIYLTAYADDETYRRAMETQPYGYLLKHTSTNELQSIIEAALQRARIEKHLRTSEERYRTLLETIPYGIIECDRAGLITYCNDHLCALMGRERKSAAGMPVDAVIEAERPVSALFATMLESAGRPSLPVSLLTPARTGQGDFIYLQCDWNYRVEDDVVAGFIGIITDVTARTRAEEALRRSLKEKEALLEERNMQREVMKAIENERHRIGQDLHDGRGQNLTAISFRVESLRRRMKGGSGDELAHIERVEKLITDAIAHTRSTSRLLCPIELEKNELVPALEDMAYTITTIFDMPCRVTKKGELSFPDPQTAIHLYYIVREAVNNALKHGGKKGIEIKLESETGMVSIVVENEISGQGPSSGASAGLGLNIMKYRAQLIGAHFEHGIRDKDRFYVGVRLIPGRAG